MLAAAAATAAAAVAATATTAHVIAGRVEERIAERIVCRLGDEVTVSVSDARALTAVLTGDLGEVTARAEDVRGRADLVLHLTGVRRAGDGVSVGAATAELAVPLAELGGDAGELSAQSGRLALSREVLGQEVTVLAEPELVGEQVQVSIDSVSIGGRELGGSFAERLVGSSDLPTVDLGEVLPDLLSPTGLAVTDEALVVRATADPAGLGGSGGCADEGVTP